MTSEARLHPRVSHRHVGFPRLAGCSLWLGLAPVWSGCVIRYGEKPEPAPVEIVAIPARPVDFGPIERRIAGLVETAEQVDARDRLERAWALAESMHDADPEAQQIVRTYLLDVIAIEERSRPSVTSMQSQALSEGFAESDVVESEELAGPEPLEKSERKPEVNLLDPMEMEGQADGEGEVVEKPPEKGPQVEFLLADAVRHLEAKHPDLAMKVLEECRTLPCWAEVKPSWEKARDAMVYARKEDLALRFMELRREPDVAKRRSGLLQIQQELSSLRASWPDCAHAEDIVDHMARVQTELEQLPED